MAAVLVSNVNSTGQTHGRYAMFELVVTHVQVKPEREVQSENGRFIGAM